MSEFKFLINRETALTQISEEEYEGLERAADGEVRMYRLRPVMARFLTGPDGVILPHAQAMKALGTISMNETMRDVFPAFFQAMKELAVPNMSGDSLRPLSEVQPHSESPTG